MPRLSKIGAAALAAFGWTGLSGVSVDFLVIAGGGGGGSGGPASDAAGGGGAGGYRTSAGTSGGGGSAEGKLSLNPLLSYTVTVGAGGIGGVGTDIAGTVGGSSTLSSITSVGGGRGGVYTSTSGQDGGSGGGGGTGGSINVGGGVGTANQGFAGGGCGTYPNGSGGGGGGAGAAGTAGGNTSGSLGNGGNGVASSISGSSLTYAGGGGGGGGGSNGGTGGGGAGNAAGTAGTAGTANLGAGGGGGKSSGANSPSGGNGGSGVVIISYPSPQKFGGGVVTVSGANTIHTFQTSGTLSPLSTLTASYLIVAGGGGASGGGGGAGGYLSGSGVTIDTNSTYLVTVGAGGTGQGASTTGSNGANSAFSMVTTTAIGGGGSGFFSNSGGGVNNGASGGSGGGGGGADSGFTAGTGGAGTSGQGNAGGNGVALNTTQARGGGGGAGAVGANGSGSTGGAGGVGLTSSISGTSTYYAGGGGGGSGNSTNASGGLGGGGAGGQAASNGSAATANTGGGGGGSGSVSPATGGNGGSGIVIISYAGSTQLMAGGTVTISGGNVIHTFTSSGYLTPLKLVNNSLRFRSSASAYLSRTPPVVGNRKTWTWSAWVKRGKLGASQRLLAINGSTESTYIEFGFSAGDDLAFGSYNNNFRITNQLFRDPSAWYHIVINLDTTQATASNRTKMYINGVEVTSFRTVYDPPLNAEYAVNLNALTYVGTATGSTSLLDGYISEFNFIDGQQLTPNSFGTFNSYGVWQPITYGGSYGTNGFYLPFTGSTTYAGVFNGSNQYLTVPDSSVWAFSGNWTVEGFFYVTNFTNTLQVIAAQWVDGGGGDRAFTLAVDSSARLVSYAQYGGNQYNPQTSTGAVSVNRWAHAALVANSSTLTLYLNGVAVDSKAITGTINNSSVPVGIGAYGNNNWQISGGLSNVRITNTAVYTGNFNVPTSNLTAISGTQLLTCQNATFVDNSTNAFTITNVNGATTSQAFPFVIGVGQDRGSAGNNWTTNNFGTQLTTGIDYMTDVPTLTSTTAANYCVVNPLDNALSASITNGNLQVTSSGASWKTVRSTFAMPTGSWYAELTSTVGTGNGNSFIGIVPMGVTLPQPIGEGSATSWGYSSNGNVYNNGSIINATGASWSAGTTVAMAFDGSTLRFYRSGTLVATISSIPTNTYTVGGSFYDNNAGAFNFGQQPFQSTPPSGFLPLNTFNL